MRLAKNEIALGVAGATAFWAVVAVFLREPIVSTAENAAQQSAVAAIQMVWLTLTQIIVGIAGLAGLFVTLRYTRQTADAAIDAAKAASLSAKAAIAIELPVIRVKPGSLSFGSAQDQDRPRREYCVVDSLIFTNLGRTKAFPIEVRCGWTIGTELPATPVYKTSKQFLISLIFEPNPAMTPKLNINDIAEIALASGDQDRIHNGTVTLWFFCCIVYDDFMQARHEVSFCWRWYEHAFKGEFRQEAVAAYNDKT